MPKIVEYSNSTKENNMEEIILKAVNAYPDDTCRTIKANYAKTSKANFESKGTWGDWSND